MDMSIQKIGYWAGMVAFGATTAFVIVQVMQLLRVVTFPADEILIYATSLCIVIPFVLEILALHYIAPLDKKYYTHAALIFSTLYAVFVTANYVVQLATVIPMKLQGREEQIRLLQQTPHSLFWSFDAIGYICMGLASFFLIPVFRKKGFQNWVRFAFLANALVTPLIGIVYFYPKFSERLLLLGFPWGITAPLSMLMLGLFFRREGFK
ncbi:MAG: hypothetical protein EOO00_10935 [Chitinophagaceae bacterium]|nr:MAG: hypothetical protein EOO00_10935 [Chitinophagaceae bacterium]